MEATTGNMKSLQSQQPKQFVYTPLQIELDIIKQSQARIFQIQQQAYHAGCAWHSDVPNVRLFCYLPSVFCLPMWHSDVEERGKSKRLPGLVWRRRA